MQKAQDTVFSFSHDILCYFRTEPNKSNPLFSVLPTIAESIFEDK